MLSARKTPPAYSWPPRAVVCSFLRSVRTTNWYAGVTTGVAKQCLWWLRSIAQGCQLLAPAGPNNAMLIRKQSILHALGNAHERAEEPGPILSGVTAARSECC